MRLGRNDAGPLGDASVSNSATPVAISGLAGAGPVTTFAYDGDGLRVANGPGGMVLSRIDEVGEVAYYHGDYLGSTRALTDAAGEVVAISNYDPYGNPTSSTGSLTQPFGFAGQYTDAETGQYLRARYYDPATAQFLIRDPLVGLTGQPYACADNNPVN